MNLEEKYDNDDELTEDALARRIYHLNTLYELNQEISTLTSIEDVIKASLLYIIGVSGSKSGLIAIYNDSTPSVYYYRGIRKNSVVKWFNQFANHLNEPYINEIHATQDNTSSNMSCLLENFDFCVWLPIKINDEKWGGIALGKKLSESCFTADDIELLSTIVINIQNVLNNVSLIEALSQSIIKETRIRNIFQRYAPKRIIDEVLNPSNEQMLLGESQEIRSMFEQMIASLEDQYAMERELALANEVQRHLLPNIPPKISGISIAAISIPARGVCGDFYDFISINPYEVLILLADISGKGMSAAMIATMLQSATRMCFGNYYPIPAVLSILNRFMFQHTDESRYATIFYGTVDTNERTFTYSNAGHPPAILYSNGNLKLLETGGPMIGLFEPCSYEQEKIKLHSDDILIIYSDGVTDAGTTIESENQDDAFGYERLASLIKNNVNLSANELVKAISDEVIQYVGGNKQFDDITLIVMKVE